MSKRTYEEQCQVDLHNDSTGKLGRAQAMRCNSIRDALRQHDRDDTPTESSVDEIDLYTGKIRAT